MSTNDPDKLAEQLSAYLDGELDEMERAAAEAILRDDASARSRLARLRETADMLRSMPRASAPPGMVQDVLVSIERGDVPAGEPSATARAPARWLRIPRPLMAAAGIVVAVGAGVWALSVSLRPTWPPPLGPVSQFSREREVPSIGESVVERGIQTGPTVAADETAPSKNDDAVVPQEHEPETERLAFADTQNQEWKPTLIMEQLESSAAMAMAKRASDADADAYAGAGAASTSDLQLEIVCSDASDLRRCRRSLDEFVAKLGPPEAPGAAGWHAADVPDVTVQRTFRLPASELNRLVALFDGDSVAQRRVSLSAGGLLRAEGWPRTRALLGMVTDGAELSADETTSTVVAFADGTAKPPAPSPIPALTPHALTRSRIQTERVSSLHGSSQTEVRLDVAETPVRTKATVAGESPQRADAVLAPRQEGVSPPNAERMVTVTIRIRIPAASPVPGDPRGRSVDGPAKDPQ